jgi:hypothetical protein
MIQTFINHKALLDSEILLIVCVHIELKLINCNCSHECLSIEEE